MGNVPLHLDWKEILSSKDNDAPPPDVEFVPNGDQGILRTLTDQQIQEKVNRVLNTLSTRVSENLPDKGKKLRENLHMWQAELDRRKLNTRKVVEVPERFGPPKTAETSGLVNNSNSSSAAKPEKSTFGSLFSKRIEERAVPASNGRWRSKVQDKCEDSRRNEAKLSDSRNSIKISSHVGRVSSKLSPFQCASTFSNRNSDCRVTRPSESHCAGRTFADCSVKRRKTFENNRASDKQSRKAQHVVLLDEEEEELNQQVLVDTPDAGKEARIYYPSRDDPECIELSYADIKCLEPQEYLTSPIMNFYIRYLQKPLSPTGRPRGEYYFFNTYFYKKLEEAVSRKSDSNARFLKLRRWWKDVIIFQKAYIFLPIHGDMHWSLVIICIPDKEDELGPIVLHLDSLGMHSSDRILDVVSCFLKEEWNYINKHALPSDLPISERIWNHLPDKIEKKRLMVPQQKNDYDCGLFVLYFMERIINEAPERLKRKDLAKFGSKWFQPEEASSLRERIKDLLVEEFENSRLNTDGNQDSPASSCSSHEENDVQQFIDV